MCNTKSRKFFERRYVRSTLIERGSVSLQFHGCVPGTRCKKWIALIENCEEGSSFDENEERAMARTSHTLSPPSTVGLVRSWPKHISHQ